VIAFFKRNLLFTSIMLLPYALLLRCSQLIFPPESVPRFESGGILYELLIGWIPSGAFEILLSTIFIFLEAWVVNLIINRNRLAKSQNALAGMIYVLLMSIFYKIYKKPKSSFHIFNTGMFFGLASLCFNPYLLLLPVGILGILILNSIDLKRILQLLIGFGISYYLLYIILLNLGLGDELLESIKGLTFHNPFPMSIEGYIQLGIISLLITIGLLSYNSYMIKKSIQAQQKINMFYWIMLLALPAGIFLADLDLFHTTILAIPLAVMMHMSVLKIKNNFLALHINFQYICFKKIPYMKRPCRDD